MKTVATVIVSFLVFIGLGCSFVAGGVLGYAMGKDYYGDKEFKQSVRPYYAKRADKED